MTNITPRWSANRRAGSGIQGEAETAVDAAVKHLFKDGDEVYVTDGFAHNAIDKEVIAQEIRRQFPAVNVKTIDIAKVREFAEMIFDGLKICCGSFYLVSKIYE